MTNNAERETIAFLGTGIMGFPMARRLIRAGFPVRAWNRTKAKAMPLAQEGAIVVDTPVDTVAGASVVVTMLTDAEAVAGIMESAFDRIEPTAVWIQTSTVGDEGADRLAALADKHGIEFVDAPVLGTRKPAEEGNLRVLASGSPAVIDRCRPVLETWGSVFTGLGAAGQGSRLKLAVNEWVLALNDATAASIALAELLGLDGRIFLDAIEGSPTDSPYAHLKGAAMLGGDAPVSFAVSSAAKDARLIADAAQRAGGDTALIRAIHDHLAAVAEAGQGNADMAAVVQAHRGQLGSVPRSAE